MALDTALRRIAIIDDDADSRLLAKAVLGPSYEVLEFDSAESALLALAPARPQAVLLDLALPGMDGLYLLRWLREEPTLRHVPVIAFTAHAERGREQRLLQAGFDGCVVKPLLSEAALVGVVQKALAHGHSSSREATLQP